MAQQPQQVQRTFAQQPNALSFYCDFSQIVGTENEVLLQFYETIPDAPNQAGQVTQVRSTLRATIMMSRPHALQLAQNLLRQLGIGAVGGPGPQAVTPAPRT
jgi:hypothetical protein